VVRCRYTQSLRASVCGKEHKKGVQSSPSRTKPEAVPDFRRYPSVCPAPGPGLRAPALRQGQGWCACPAPGPGLVRLPCARARAGAPALRQGQGWCACPTPGPGLGAHALRQGQGWSRLPCARARARLRLPCARAVAPAGACGPCGSCRAYQCRDMSRTLNAAEPTHPAVECHGIAPGLVVQVLGR